MYFLIFSVAVIVLVILVVYFVVSAKVSNRRKQYERLAAQIGGEITDSFDTDMETVSINPANHIFQNALPAGTIANLTTAEIDAGRVRVFDHYIRKRKEWTEDAFETIKTTRVDLRSENLALPFFEIVRNFSERESVKPTESISFEEMKKNDETYKVFGSKEKLFSADTVYQIYSHDEKQVKSLFDRRAAAYFRDFANSRGFEFKNIIGNNQEISIIADDTTIDPAELLRACRELAELLKEKRSLHENFGGLQ